VLINFHIQFTPANSIISTPIRRIPMSGLQIISVAVCHAIAGVINAQPIPYWKTKVAIQIALWGIGMWFANIPDFYWKRVHTTRWILWTEWWSAPSPPRLHLIKTVLMVNKSNINPQRILWRYWSNAVWECSLSGPSRRLSKSSIWMKITPQTIVGP